LAGWDNGTTRNTGDGTSFESVFGGNGVSLDNLPIAGYKMNLLDFKMALLKGIDFSSGSGFNITPTGESGSGLFVTLLELDPDNTTNLYYANINLIYRTATHRKIPEYMDIDVWNRLKCW
jgi:hypothetical protein